MASSARATMFGLDLQMPGSLTWLAESGAGATGRPVELTVGAEADSEWLGDATPISDERTEDGGVLFQIARGERGFRFSGPRYGTAIVSPRASSVCGAPGEGRDLSAQGGCLIRTAPCAPATRILSSNRQSAWSAPA